MKEVQYWDSGGKEEIRKIPIVCSACGKSVSLGGKIQDEGLVLENCPACNAPLFVMIYTGIDDETESEKEGYPISADIKWEIKGGVQPEQSAKFGPMIQVPRLLISVLNSGIEYFSHSGMSVEFLFGKVCTMLVEQVLPPKRVGEVLDICTQRLTDAVQEPSAFTVIGDSGVKEEIEPSDEENNHDE